MVRIKNRLDPCYDSALSSGYRDVMINICIKTPETTSLRVQHHVAELQLILREVYECCTTPGTHSENVFSTGTLYSTYARPLTFQNVVPHHTRRTPDVCPLPQSPRPIVVCARGVGEGGCRSLRLCIRGRGWLFDGCVCVCVCVCVYVYICIYPPTDDKGFTQIYHRDFTIAFWRFSLIREKFFVLMALWGQNTFRWPRTYPR